MTHQIRWLIRRDMQQVLDIEEASFEFPWDEDTFLQQLRQRNIIGMVYATEYSVLGYCIYELHKTRYDIMNIAVHPRYRHQGVATSLVNRLINKLDNRRSAVSTIVRETNLSAQLFFQRQGFRATNVLRNWYDDCDEDGYAMQWTAEVPSLVTAREKAR